MSFVAKVGDAEFISSGTVFCKQGDEINLCPFGSDEEYRLLFILSIDEGEGVEPNLYSIAGDIFTIKLVRPWLDGRPSVNLDALIAQTGEHNYFMSFSVNIIGLIERYAVQLTYAISRKLK